MKQKNTKFLLLLPPELKSRLEAAAKQGMCSMNSFARHGIEAACAKAEEQAHNKPLEEEKK